MISFELYTSRQHILYIGWLMNWMDLKNEPEMVVSSVSKDFSYI